MRYPASEKLEIIRTVEQSSLGVRRTLQQVGIPRSTFYNWYDRYVSEGFDGLEDKKPAPGPVWNKVPEDIAEQLVEFALAEPDLSPRELAVRFTEERRYYLSESTVYRVLKSHDLITAPAFIVLNLETLGRILLPRFPGVIHTGSGDGIWREANREEEANQRFNLIGQRMAFGSCDDGVGVVYPGGRAGNRHGVPDHGRPRKSHNIFSGG